MVRIVFLPEGSDIRFDLAIDSSHLYSPASWLGPVELHRVYPRRVEHGTVIPGTPEGTGELHTRVALAEREVELLRVQLEREREISRGLEQDRDHWRAQATGLLAAPPVPTSPAAPGRLRQAWRALLGRKG